MYSRPGPGVLLAALMCLPSVCKADVFYAKVRNVVVGDITFSGLTVRYEKSVVQGAAHVDRIRLEAVATSMDVPPRNRVIHARVIFCDDAGAFRADVLRTQASVDIQLGSVPVGLTADTDYYSPLGRAPRKIIIEFDVVSPVNEQVSDEYIVEYLQ